MKLMGNNFDFVVVARDADWANQRIDNAVREIKRIEILLTTFSASSETSRINAAAGISAVKVSREVFNLVERCNRIAAITDGAFDISYGSIDKSLWNFDRTMTSLPDPKTAGHMVRLINYRNIELDQHECSVFLRLKGMRIGFGGIGKGYAADMAKSVMLNEGVESGIINASGDMITWGNQANGKPWTVGIADPDNTQLPFSYLSISNLAIATSGNYEKYVMIGGKKYSHTINPKTGLPVTGIKSVTIITANAELADALATPVTVMGIRSGLHLVNQMQQVECIIIDDTNKIYTSKNIHLHETDAQYR
ncbi:MAG: FAD:protein FMN transferase [Chitinophagaceae bacterium]|nr:MAG: FAD:protein FMN transferase [Chitinophagaceae bacterium]